MSELSCLTQEMFFYFGFRLFSVVSVASEDFIFLMIDN